MQCTLAGQIRIPGTAHTPPVPICIPKGCHVSSWLTGKRLSNAILVVCAKRRDKTGHGSAGMDTNLSNSIHLLFILLFIRLL